MYPKHDPTFLGIAEVARRSSQNYSTIARAVRSGTIPSVRQGGRWLIPSSYLDELERLAYERADGDDPPEAA